MLLTLLLTLLSLLLTCTAGSKPSRQNTVDVTSSLSNGDQIAAGPTPWCTPNFLMGAFGTEGGQQGRKGQSSRPERPRVSVMF